ncbi:SCO family protein [Sphingomonas sp. AOB5]|uniref:SCO family protein n=1 Tax=Sphingomonas sp. AOB5 TaxID=3034017 RepID=UPI0023F81E20|nr:SCO family protein [Sphingomonas sp. AOB5]MDF7774193.1 SCO family protein [Sphingomonas sp. AOB5]
MNTAPPSGPSPAPLRRLRLILWGLVAVILLVLAVSFGWQVANAPKTGQSDTRGAIDVTGKPIGAPFTLTDQDGKTVRDSDFAGKYRLIYFGYTFCPDICPTDVQKLGLAMRRLDREAPAVSAKVQPIFITIDPERDTPPVIKQFVSAFHPRLIGLTGTVPQITALAKGYAAFFAKLPPAQPGGSYLMNHSAMFYLMGPKGEPLVILPREMSDADVAAEIRKWVK